MKILVLGVEISEGISKKTNKPYSIGKVHAAMRLVGSEGAVGYGAQTLSCDTMLLERVRHVEFPQNCEVEIEAVLRYGEQQTSVVSIVALGTGEIFDNPSKPASLKKVL